MKHAFRVVLLPKPLHPSGRDAAVEKAKKALLEDEAPGDEAAVTDDLGGEGRKRSVLHVKARGSASKATLVTRMKAELSGSAESIEYHVCRHDEDPPQPCGVWEVV